MTGKVKCTCGWSWNKSDSSKKDMYICHECGRDNSNNMKNGGWLDNYNDYNVSASEEMIGDGFSNVGRNSSPAWGGQFQEGGKLTFLQPTSDKLPEGYRIPYSDPSSERAISIGGEDGEPAYLIPSFKYGKPLDDPMGEFRNTGEHLGGPFKTWQEADKWENETRHPAVERKENIMFPQEQFQMGGNLPGAVGNMYARTGSPSEGKYAKKTLPSAKNGLDSNTLPPPKSIGKPKDVRKKGDVMKLQSMYNTDEVNYVPTVESLKGLKNPNLSSIENAATDQFVDWYSNPETLKRTKTAGYDPARIKDFIAKGLKTPIKVNDRSSDFPMNPSGEGEYRSPYVSKQMDDPTHPDTGYIMYNPQATDIETKSVIGHELPHAAGLDNLYAPSLYKALDLKLPEKYHGGLQYMDRPEEVYGNFQEMRLQMGLKPGQTIDYKTLYDKMKDDKIPNNFWRNFSTDPKTGKPDPNRIKKIVKAINTVAQVDNTQQDSNIQTAQNGAWLDNYDEAQNGKKFKLKDERELAYKTAESTNVKKKNFDLEQSKSNKSYINQLAVQQKENKRRKALTQDQREREDYNARNEERGSIQAPVKESKWDRTKAIVSNPLTAFGYAARNESLPARFQYGPRNDLDTPIDFINPLQGIASASEIPGELSRGEFLNAGLSLLDAADLGVYAKGAIKASKPFLQKAGQQLGNISTSITPELRQGLATQGFANPLGIVDRVVPRPPTPGMLLGMEDSWNNYSPLNWIPGYGEKLSAASSHPNFVGFRKFGNSIQDVIESQSLRPKGTGMGSKQIMSEGNWAEPGKVNENYSGVFEATMNPQIKGSNIKLEKLNKRNGIVGTTQEGDVAIPLTDTGLSFNRRLPFSNRYVPIDKEKLINNQFQLSTQLPYLQSLTEKYGLWAGGAGAAGYFTGGSEGAKENINTLNEYTIDPLINLTKPYYNEAKKELTGQTSQYKDGGIIKDDRGQWDHPGEITRISGGNITMKRDPKTGKALTQPILGIADTGEEQWMYPGEDYNFEGAEYVDEYPKGKRPKKAQNGLRQEQKSLQNLDNLLNFTNYNKPQPGGWLNKYN